MRPPKRKQSVSSVTSSKMSDEFNEIKAWADIRNEEDQEYDGDQEGETDNAPLSEKGTAADIRTIT
jgi:hypothetical protein